MDLESVAQFTAITGSSNHTASQYLSLAEGNTEQAIELFFANDGADLETSTHSQQSTIPPPVPPPSTRPTHHRQNYQDRDGVVHLDSDQDDDDGVDDDDGIKFIGHGRRQIPAGSNTYPSARDSGNITPSVGRAGTAADDDESIARRLQEEFYGAAGRGNGNNNASSEVLDEYGYRAPLGRTTETLVGPGSFDPANAEEMRAAVAEQVLARRQPSRPRGKLPW